MLLANNATDVVRTSWPSLSRDRSTSPAGNESSATNRMEDEARKPTKPSRPYRNSPSAPKKYLLVDQSDQQPRTAPLTKKNFLARPNENDEALNVIFNPVFSLSDEYEELERNNMLTDSPTPPRKTSFTDGSPSRGSSRENSPRRWHSMPQEPNKRHSPVLPGIAKHRLKSPGPSVSQLTITTNGGSDGRQSEEGSVLSSDEEATDSATAMASSPKVATVKRQMAVAKGKMKMRRATVGNPEQKRKYSYDEKGTPAAKFRSKRSNSVCSFHPNGECPLGAGSGLEVLDVLCNRLDNILRDEAKNNVDTLTCRLDQNQIIADLQEKNRSLEEKNKVLEEKCEQFSKDGKQIQQHLSTLLKTYQALEKRLSDVTAEKEAYINRLVSIYKSGKDISLDDEHSPKTPATPLQANGKSPSPSAKHFHTLPHPPKSKSQLKETSV